MLMPSAVFTHVRMPSRTLENAPTAAPTVIADAQGKVDDYGTVAAYLSAGAVARVWVFDTSANVWVICGEGASVADKTFGAANSLGYWTAPTGSLAYIQLDTGSLTLHHNLFPLNRSLSP